MKKSQVSLKILMKDNVCFSGLEEMTSFIEEFLAKPINKQKFVDYEKFFKVID